MLSDMNSIQVCTDVLVCLAPQSLRHDGKLKTLKIKLNLYAIYKALDN